MHVCHSPTCRKQQQQDPHTVQQNQWSEFHTDACILISEFLTPPLCVTRLIRLYYEHNLFFWPTRTIKICAFGELRLLQHHWWGGHAWNSHIIKINTTTPFQSTSVVLFYELSTRNSLTNDFDPLTSEKWNWFVNTNSKVSWFSHCDLVIRSQFHTVWSRK